MARSPKQRVLAAQLGSFITALDSELASYVRRLAEADPRCQACDKELTDDTSIALGIGPECHDSTTATATARSRHLARLAVALVDHCAHEGGDMSFFGDSPRAVASAILQAERNALRDFRAAVRARLKRRRNGDWGHP